VYACVDRGQLFAYFGWVHPRRRIFCVCADRGRCRRGSCDRDPPCGAQTARPRLTGDIALRSHRRTHHRRDPVSRCGVLGHLCDRWIDQRASGPPARDRDCPSSLLFAVAHTRTMGIPWLVFFGMGTLARLCSNVSYSSFSMLPRMKDCQVGMT
jgi:hypothetical protein